MLSGLLLATWIRWWAVPVVGVGGAIVIASIAPNAALAGALLGAANALVGVLAALGLRKLAMPRQAASNPR
jgi:hypothetical protein